MKSTEILQAAIDIQAARAAEYDQPGGERSMGRTVQAFNAITGRDLTEAEGWLLLQVLKDVRQWSAKDYHHDSALDGVAYSALKAEALAGAQRTDAPVFDPTDPNQWMVGDELRGNSGSLYTLREPVSGKYAQVITPYGTADQALVACVDWVSRPEAAPVPQAPEGAWWEGDRVEYKGGPTTWFSNGERCTISHIGEGKVTVRNAAGTGVAFKPKDVTDKFKWISRP